MQYLLNLRKDIQTLDPQLADPNEEILVNALFDGLAEYDSTGTQIEPSLAVSWEKNADSTIWTFNLRKEAKWTDGKPITANDFVYSWRRALAHETAAPNSELLYYIKNAENYSQNQVKPEDVGINAPDDYTLQVTMENPTPFFDKLVAKSVFRPVPRQAVEKFGKDWTKSDNIISSGAFLLNSWNTLDGTIVVQKDEAFWDNANTKLSTVIFYSLDPSGTGGKAVIDLYESRKINATRNLTNIESLNAGNNLLVGMLNSLTFLSINTTIEPFNDVRVRKALSLAIDREKLKETGAGQYPTDSFTPPFKDYENVKTAGFNPVEARRLLAEAGFPKGKNFPEVEYIYSYSEVNAAVAQFVKAQLEKELGIRVKLNSMSPDDFLKKRTAADFTGIAAVDWVGDYIDPNSFFEVFGTDQLPIGWEDEKYNEILDSADAESDMPKRYALLHEAETILAEQQPVIPLYIGSDRILCKPYIKNLVPNPLGQINWREVYIDESLYK